MKSHARRLLFRSFSVGAALALLVSAQGVAQNGGVTWSVIASGGVNDAVGDNLRMSATLGQSVIGLASGPGVSLSQGFWFPLRLLSSVPFEPTTPTAPFALRNYPNPFRVLTTISYRLDDASNVALDIVDLAGRQIATLGGGYQSSGEHKVEWNGLDDAGHPVPAGIYVYTLRVRDNAARGIETLSRQKMMLVR